MPKFFVSPDAVRGRFLTLDGENAAHAKVLRLRRGDSVLVCDGCGTAYRCTVSDISPQQVCLVVNSTEASGAEPLVACSVYMAYAKADKLPVLLKPYGGPGFQQVVFYQAYYWVAQWWDP